MESSYRGDTLHAGPLRGVKLQPSNESAPDAVVCNIQGYKQVWGPSSAVALLAVVCRCSYQQTGCKRAADCSAATVVLSRSLRCLSQRRACMLGCCATTMWTAIMYCLARSSWHHFSRLAVMPKLLLSDQISKSVAKHVCSSVVTWQTRPASCLSYHSCKR
jgi:hypothetical protein